MNKKLKKFEEHSENLNISFDEMKEFVNFLLTTDDYFYDKNIKSWFDKKTLLKITIEDIWEIYKN